MKRILILGARGRLAAALARCWAPRHDVAALTRDDVDVADRAALEACLRSRTYDILVNGTGLTNVDACEVRREEAHAVNAAAPAWMAAAATACGARFLHFSTDYVFDGKNPEPYVEDDVARPLGWYGATKLAGEQAVLEQSPHHLVFRVSWVFGPEKPSFADHLIARAQREDQVAAIADKFSCPTFADDAASWAEPFFGPALPGGLYHACNSGRCSWQEFGQWALDCAAARGVPLRTTTVRPQSLAEMKSFTACRPVHTILGTGKLARTIGIPPRPWREALREYLQNAPIPPAN